MSALARLTQHARRAGSAAALDVAARVVARHHGLAVACVRAPAAPGRRAKEAAKVEHPRNEMIYLACVGLGQSARHVAAAVGVDHARVVRLVQRIEELRDRPGFSAYDVRLDDMHLEVLP